MRAPTQGERSLYVGTFYSEELDTVYRIEADGDSLVMRVGNFVDGSLLVEEEDVLRRGGLTLRFLREEGAMTGFLLDAGRVKNLRFVRR